MLVHRLNRLQGHSITANQIVSDPKGEVIGLFVDGTLHLLKLQELYGYIDDYKMQFRKDKKYSLVKDLPLLGSVAPSFSQIWYKKVILSSKISQQRRQQQQRQQITQYQYCSFIGQQKIQIVKILYKDGTVKTLNSKCINIKQQMIHTNKLESKLYITTYKLSFYCIDLQKGQIQEQNIKVIKRDQKILSPQSKTFLKMKEIARYCNIPKIWQTSCGYLMKESQVVSMEMEEYLNMTHSVDEQEYLSKRQSFPIKYHLSQCKQYLIGSSQLVPFMSRGQRLFSQFFSLRSMKYNLQSVFTFNSVDILEVNQYWTQHFRMEQKKLNFKKEGGKKEYCDIIVLAQYYSQDDLIIVSRIMVRQKRKKKMSADGKGYEIIDKKLKGDKTNLTGLARIKHKVMSMMWVGLTQLMWIQQYGQVMYMQFSPQHLNYQ